VEAVVWSRVARRVSESLASGELPLAAPVPSLGGVTFQRAVAWLPTRFGGLGPRGSVGGRFAAFLGSIEQAVPALVSVCERSPAFKRAVGFVEVLSGPHQRWGSAFEFGCRLGEEVRVAASSLRLEAMVACAPTCTWFGLAMAEAGLGEPFMGHGSTHMVHTSRSMPKRPKKKAMRGHTMAKTLHFLGSCGILAPMALASG